jgi:hypothetical protein
MGGGPATAKVASYVLVAADAGTTVAMNAAGATTITVNTGLFAAGDTVFIQNLGAGACTVTAGTATVATAGSLILPQNDEGILYFTSASAAIFYDYIQAGAVSPLTTKGDLYTFSTSDARLGVGANGTTLVADSSEATGLKWDTPASGGGYTEIATGTLSGSSVSITSIPGTYKDLILYVYDYTINSTGGSPFFRVNSNSSGIYRSTGVIMEDSSGTAAYTNNGGTEEYFTGYGQTTYADLHTTINFYNYANTAAQKNFSIVGTSFQTSTSRYTVKNGMGTVVTTSAITSIQITANANSFASGTYYLYGVK